MHTFKNVEFADAQSADAKSADAKSADAKSADAQSLDSLHRAYGRKVHELLSQSDAATRVEDLWDMYTGFTHFSQHAGYDPNGHNKFVSFKELVFFFQEVGSMKAGRLV